MQETPGGFSVICLQTHLLFYETFKDTLRYIFIPELPLEYAGAKAEQGSQDLLSATPLVLAEAPQLG